MLALSLLQKLYVLHRRIVLRMQIFRTILNGFSAFSLGKRSRYVRGRMPIGRKRSRRSYQPKRGREINLTESQIEARTGLAATDFEAIASIVEESISRPRANANTTRVKTILSTRTRLTLVLQWLREYPRLQLLGDLYDLHTSTISRDIRHIVPKLVVAMRTVSFAIQWPSIVEEDEFENVVGAIDCTPHFRKRVHPMSGDYYRGDYKRFLVLSQLTVSLKGRMMDLVIARGHNNDMAVYRLSGIDAFLAENNMFLLADGGYSDIKLVTPDRERDQEWNEIQKKKRSVVEMVFARVKSFFVAAIKCRHSPEMQTHALRIVYTCANASLIRNPVVIE